MDDIFSKPGAGLRFPTGGENVLLWAAIGVAVLLFAYFLFDFIVQRRREREFSKRVTNAKTKHQESENARKLQAKG